MNFKKVILLIWGGLLIYIIYTFAIYQMDRQNDRQVYEALRNSFYGNEALPEEAKELANVSNDSNDSEKMILERYHSILEINDELGITVVMVLHDLNQAVRYSHRLVVIKDGRFVMEGTPEEVLTKELLRNVYHVEAEVTVDKMIGKPVFLPIGLSYAADF